MVSSPVSFSGLGLGLSIMLMVSLPHAASAQPLGLYPLGAVNSDSDRLSDSEELTFGTNPALTDTDGDLISDSDELLVTGTEPLLADSDMDGLTDYEEWMGAQTTLWDVNLNGMLDEDPLDRFPPDEERPPFVIGEEPGLIWWMIAHYSDYDMDNLPDREEMLYGNSNYFPYWRGYVTWPNGEGETYDSEIWGGPDHWQATDYDHDGLTAAEETTLGSDPYDADTDGDGLQDGADYEHGNALLTDANSNGINDHDELMYYGYANQFFPTEYDLAAQMQNGLGSSPLGSVLDWDRDGMSNIWEMANGLNPVDPLDAYDDPDGDFLMNIEEYRARTNPQVLLSSVSTAVTVADIDAMTELPVMRAAVNDTEAVTGLPLPAGLVRDNGPMTGFEYDDDWDGDGDSNRTEMNLVPARNPRIVDSLDADGDGLLDSWEVLNGLDKTDEDEDDDGVLDGADDFDADQLTNLQEQIYGTDPQVTDTDGDGLPDGWEASGSLNPVNSTGADGASGDPDNDGLSNLVEYQTGTFPVNADSDLDRLPDGWEVLYSFNPRSFAGIHGGYGDPDGDGVINFEEFTDGSNPRNADSDADSWTDGEERQLGTSSTVQGSQPSSENISAQALDSSVTILTSVASYYDSCSIEGPYESEDDPDYWKRYRATRSPLDGIPFYEMTIESDGSFPSDMIPPPAGYNQVPWPEAGSVAWQDWKSIFDDPSQSGHVHARQGDYSFVQEPAEIDTTSREWSVEWRRMRLKSSVRMPMTLSRSFLAVKTVKYFGSDGTVQPNATTVTTELKTLVLPANDVLGPELVMAPSLSAQSEESWLLCPIAMISNGGGTGSELAVAKMEDSLGSGDILNIDADPDRFYVRIQNLVTEDPVSVTLSTLNPDSSYNDDPTSIDMTADGDCMITKSMLLVSDDEDDKLGDDEDPTPYGLDDEANDRTHKVQLGGEVRITNIRIGTEDFPCDIRVPVPVKARLRAQFLNASDSQVTDADIGVDIRLANERFAQIGIKLENSAIIPLTFPTSPPFGMASSDVWFSDIGAENLMSKCQGTTNTINDVQVYYVRSILDDSPGYDVRGFAIMEKVPRNTSSAAANTIIMTRVTNTFNLAHELLHLLTQRRHYGGSPVSGSSGLDYELGASAHKVRHALMRDLESFAGDVGSGKRIYNIEFGFITGKPNFLLSEP